MSDTKPKWNRRKEDRPAEIVEAAMDVFVEHGFAGTKLSEVAKRAGVAKGTLYLYFDTKEDLFRATARQALAANLDAMEQASTAFGGSVVDFVPVMLKRAAGRMGDGRIPGIVRMVLGESRAFPDLARIWHDEVVSRVLTLLSGMIETAQAEGNIRPGDPKLYAFSVIGPMIVGLLFHEFFGQESPHAPDLEALAIQHSEAVLRGIIM
jgi:AcrR family transcriptional regulator